MAAFNEDPAARAEREGSLFLRIARFCQQETLTMQEMRQLLKPSWLQRSCFDIPLRAGGRLRQALCLSEDDWTIVNPRGLVEDFEVSTFIVSQLRYCPRCLATGWHSALFQHLGLRSCPQHGVALAIGCPRCGTAIVPSPASLVEHHLFCPDCGESLAGPRIGLLQTDVQRFAAVRAAFHWPVRAPLVVWPPDQRADNYLRSAADCNAAAVHSVWTRDRVRGLRAFEHVIVALPGGERESPIPVLRRYIYEHTVNVLKWLMGCVSLECGYAAMDACARRVRRFNVIGGGELSVVAVAFWQTALALNMPESFGEVPAEFHSAWSHPAQSWLPDRAEVLHHAIQAHALTLYAVTLLKVRKYRSVKEIHWDRLMANTADVTPAWWVEGCGKTATWVQRTRIEKEGVLRLLRRYRRAMVPAAACSG